MKLHTILILSLAGLLLVACQPDIIYVPVDATPAPAPRKTTYKPKPVETAEGFRAVEKPTTYSN